ncbi:hypothetical protein [Mixta calida]|uniref:hypothetical protein n=1 Tax=Mixta calida TaxID=665913 RepID=UPI0029089EF6|nr:hypothetical protein [Mixta calida]MDU4288645.1 hypothetical protein [Mixta calida]
MATQQQIEQIRAYAYFPSQTQLPDLVIARKIDEWLQIYPQNEPMALYKALISSLQCLIYTDPNLEAGSGTGGNSRTEQVGQVQVTTETTGEYISKYQHILDGYLQGDLRFPGIKSPKGLGVIIGGVDQREIDRVNTNSTSRK